MGWTAAVTAVGRNAHGCTATVRFDNPETEESFSEVFTGAGLDQDGLADIVSRRVDELLLRDASAATLVLGPIYP